ncbi:hypothetical protein FQA39_LY13671 [Lamprigera yunnana]|nr:hypothetical protein FQA39_LY13671 [Lamprigera yunnana]
MKIFLLVLIFCLREAQGQQNDTDEDLAKPRQNGKKVFSAMKLCSQRNNVTVRNYDEYLKALSVGGEQIQAFSQCYLQEMNHTDKNGNILYDEIKKLPLAGMPPENYSSLVEKCKNETGTNVTETSYKFYRCLLTNLNQTVYQQRLRIYEQQQEQIRKELHAMAICSKRNNITIEDHKIYLNALAVGGQKITIFSECYLKELGYINSNGEILYDEIGKSPFPGVSSSKYMALVNRCKGVTGNSTAEASYKFSYCLLLNLNETLTRFRDQTQQQQQMQLKKELIAMKVCSKWNKINVKTHDDYLKALSVGGKNVQSFSECYLRELGYLNSSGEILYDEVKKAPYPLISAAQYSDFVDQCSTEYGNSTSETCYKFSYCLLSNVNETLTKLLNNLHQAQQQQVQKQQNALRTCSEETNMKIQDLNEYLRALNIGGQQVKSFSMCYLREMGYLDKNGEILYEDVKKIPFSGISATAYFNLVDQCKGKKGNSTTETSYKFSHCLLSKVNKTLNGLKSQIQQQQEQQAQKQLDALRICSKRHNIKIKNYVDYLKELSVGGTTIQSFSECFLRQLGCLNSSGEILYDEVKKLPIPGFTAAQYYNFVDQCSDEKGNNTTETCYKFSYCLLFTANQTLNELNQQILLQQQQHNQKQINALKACSEINNIKIKNLNEYYKALSVGGSQIKIFSECYLRKLGYLSSNDEILYEEIKKNVYPGISANQYYHIVEKCRMKKENITAETSYKLSYCLLSNIDQTLRGINQYGVQQQQLQYKQQLDALNNCSRQNNITIRNHNDYLTALSAGGQKIKSFSKCYFQQLRYLDSDGEILYEHVKYALFPGCTAAQYGAIVEQCREEKGNSTEATCYKFSYCLYSNLNTTLTELRRKAAQQVREQQLNMRKQVVIMEICSTKHQITIRNHEEYRNALSVDGEQIRAFSECYWKELGYLSKNGDILYEEVKKIPFPGVPADQYSGIVDQCSDEKGNTTTETSYKFSHCFFDNLYQTVLDIRSQQEQQHQQQQTRKINDVFKICSKKSSIVIRNITEYLKALSVGGPQVHMFAQCYLKETGYLDSNGDILYERVKKVVPSGISSNTYSKIIDECKGERGSNSSETCYKFANCITIKTAKFYKETQSKSQ